MYTEEFWDKTRRIIGDAYNKGHIDAFDEIIAPDFVRRQPPFPDIVGLEAWKQYVADVRVSYPDAQLKLGEGITQGGTAATLWTFEGTQTGVSPTTGAPGTGRHVSCTGLSLDRYEEGKLVKEQAYGDWLSLLQQIGAVPNKVV